MKSEQVGLTQEPGFFVFSHGNDCPAGLEPPEVAKNRRKTTVKIQRSIAPGFIRLDKSYDIPKAFDNFTKPAIAFQSRQVVPSIYHLQVTVKGCNAIASNRCNTYAYNNSNLLFYWIKKLLICFFFAIYGPIFPRSL